MDVLSVLRMGRAVRFGVATLLEAFCPLVQEDEDCSDKQGKQHYPDVDVLKERVMAAADGENATQDDCGQEDGPERQYLPP